MTVCLCVGYAGLHAYARQSNAFSEEGQFLSKGVLSATKVLEESQALFGSRQQTLSMLAELAPELNPAALNRAVDFIKAMPDGLPMPEVTAEPDGDVSLDWIASRHRMLSISVGPRPRLAIAWLNGTSSGHSVEQFDGAMVSMTVLGKIRSTLSPSHAPVWAA